MAALGVMSAAPKPAQAATTNRYSTDDHGNFLIFGNTGGFDCRDKAVEKPIVGDVPTGLLGLFSCNGLFADNDTGIDILWRSQYPGNNQVRADTNIAPNEARSTAVFALPAGAKVVMARLYWASQRNAGQGAGTSVKLQIVRAALRAPYRARRPPPRSSPSTSLTTIRARPTSRAICRTTARAPYRIGNIQSVDIGNINLDVAFMAWNIVVFYHLDSEPIRNMSLFDGLERVSTSAGSVTTVNLNGLLGSRQRLRCQAGGHRLRRGQRHHG